MRRRFVFLAAALLGASAAVATASDPPLDGARVITPVEHRRPADQTFLTFPEWFLVHSPAEYARFVEDHHPSRFPFMAHVEQLWTSYAHVTEATRDQPFNAGYHAMIGVIATSTTAEYALRGAYETVIGRLAEATATHGMTEEERFGAVVAQEYVDFINVRPWYEFDFLGALERLWTDVPLTGDDMIRKWERRYVLTSEYLAKAVYGWLIARGTAAAYDPAGSITAVVIDDLPERVPEGVELVILERLSDGGVLATLPRYDAFGHQASALAAEGARFREVAGNTGTILVSAFVARGGAARVGYPVLFTQPILTRMHEERAVFAVPVAELAEVLVALRRPGRRLEHVYDF